MLFSFHTFSAIKSRTEFSNVWGEYKNHSNPYIQGTTIPCDIVTAQRKEQGGLKLMLACAHICCLMCSSLVCCRAKLHLIVEGIIKPPRLLIQVKKKL